MARFHILYKTVNLISNDYYIGIQSTSNINDGYLGSGKILKLSIKKYGKENFKREIIEFCESREKLLERERQIVNDDLLKDSYCLNINKGGNVGWENLNYNYQEKMFAARSKGGKKGGRHPNALKNLSYENVSKEERSLRALKTVRTIKERYGEDYFKTLFSKSNSDKTFSEEHRRKLREAGKKLCGEKSPSYGRIYINKDGMVKRVKPENLKIMLNSGWKKGRK